MIISRTPHRVSFFGGGTDYPSWYLEHGGKVLGAAIDKYCYITCRELPPFFNHQYRVVYSKVETVSSVSEIQHPAVKGVLEHLHVNGSGIGLEIHHDADIPARSGMGSSSAFTVGLVKTLYALEGKIISRENLYKEVIHIEQNVIKESVGSQDQVWAAMGGFNTIEFLQNGEIIVDPIIMEKQRLKNFEGKFMLYFTGISRFASEVACEQISNTRKNVKELNEIRSIVDEAQRLMLDGNAFTDFGRLLNESWQLKKRLSGKISNGKIDDLYDLAMKNGASGGKLLGAGGGGFMLFYVEPECQKNVREALKDFLLIPFKFDFSGSEIIVYKPEYNNNNGV